MAHQGAGGRAAAVSATARSSGASAKVSRDEAHQAWRRIAVSLATSDSREDRLLATQIAGFVRGAASERKILPPQQGLHRVPVHSAPNAVHRPRDRPSLGGLAAALRWNDRLGLRCGTCRYVPVASDGFLTQNCLSQIAVRSRRCSGYGRRSRPLQVRSRRKPVIATYGRY